MKRSSIIRLISGIMLVVAIIFVLCALSNPTLGSTIYIGEFAFGADEWRVCYAIYAVVMVVLFAASFIVGRRENEK